MEYFQNTLRLEKKEFPSITSHGRIGCISDVPCLHLAESHRAKDTQLLVSVPVHLSFFLGSFWAESPDSILISQFLALASEDGEADAERATRVGRT